MSEYFTLKTVEKRTGDLEGEVEIVDSNEKIKKGEKRKYCNYFSTSYHKDVSTDTLNNHFEKKHKGQLSIQQALRRGTPGTSACVDTNVEFIYLFCRRVLK